jgi:hypothetical protein
MIYTRPFVTKHFIAYAGDSRTTELSLAVKVIDAFTDRLPEVPLDVRLKQVSFIRPTRSISGFFCFEGQETVIVDGAPIKRTTIPNGNYTLTVEPDPSSGNWYFLQPKAGDPWPTNFERRVSVAPYVPPVPALPVKEQPPLELVILTPTPAYPFPANATLIRGKVLPAGNAILRAVVSTDYDEVDPQDSTQTVQVHVETITDPEGEFALFFRRLPLRNQAITLQAVRNGPPVLVNTQITEGTTVVIHPEINVP